MNNTTPETVKTKVDEVLTSRFPQVLLGIVVGYIIGCIQPECNNNATRLICDSCTFSIKKTQVCGSVIKSKGGKGGGKCGKKDKQCSGCSSNAEKHIEDLLGNYLFQNSEDVFSLRNNPVNSLSEFRWQLDNGRAKRVEIVKIIKAAFPFPEAITNPHLKEIINQIITNSTSSAPSNDVYRLSEPRTLFQDVKGIPEYVPSYSRC